MYILPKTEPIFPVKIELEVKVHILPRKITNEKWVTMEGKIVRLLT